MVLAVVVVVDVVDVVLEEDEGVFEGTPGPVPSSILSDG